MIRLRAITRQTLTMRDNTGDRMYAAYFSRKIVYASRSHVSGKDVLEHAYFRDYGMLPNHFRSSVIPTIIEPDRISVARPEEEEAESD